MSVAALAAAAARLGVPLQAEQCDALLGYVERLVRWNRVYNLTAVREPEEMLRLHVVDSLAVVGPLRRHYAGRAGVRLLDVGSGAGLPGVVIAILCPDWHLSCVDAVGKKASFVRQVAGELRLHNVQAIHGRVEALHGTWDGIVTRAFASLEDTVRLTRERLEAHGTWAAMKARVPHDEMAAVCAGARVFHVEQIDPLGTDVSRCIVWMQRG